MAGVVTSTTAIAAIARAQDSGVVSRATVGRALRELGAQDGVSGTIDPSSTEPFPRKSVWIVETAGGARSLASRWEPVKVPEPSCGKGR